MDRSRCLLTIFVALNVAFLLIGGVALGTGVWVFVEHKDLMNYLDKQTSDMGKLMTTIVCLLLVFGVAAIVFAVFGFYLSRTQTKCFLQIVDISGSKFIRLLQTYSAAVASPIAFASLLATTTFCTSTTVTTDLKTHMQQLLQNRYNSHLSAYGAGGSHEYSYGNDETLAADIIQLKFGCCGVINGSDYSNATSWNREVRGSNATMIIPATCCQMHGGAALSGILKRGTSGNLTLVNSTCPFTSYDSNINTGCYNAVHVTLKTIFLLTYSIALSAVAVQLVVSIVVLFLYRSAIKYKVMP